MQHSQMPFCEVVNNLVCVTGYDIPSFPLLIGNQMCAFCERNTHASTWGVLCQTVLLSWLPFSSFLSIRGIPKNFGCFSTTYSEKQMKVYETQRDSNPLDMFTFFFFFFFYYTQQLVGLELEPFHHGEFWSLTSVLLQLTHQKRPSGGVGWGLFVSFHSVLFFELGFQVF